MSVELLRNPEAAALAALAATAEPGVRAEPDLAESVLRVARRRRRMRVAVAGVAGSVLVTGGLAAALFPGQSDYFSVTQPSGAMEPTVAVSEQVVFNRVLEPERGDVVYALWTPPDELSDQPDFLGISRVVGLPGDEVSCPREPSGECDAVVVNGQPLKEGYVDSPTRPFAPMLVPDGEAFLLGDARNAASDSRTYGTVDLSGFEGVAVQIVDGDGEVRPVPGVPVRGTPSGGDSIDPPAPVPPANSVVNPANESS